MRLDEYQLSNLMRAVALTQDTELNCDGCLERLSAYAEAELLGKAAIDAFEQVRQHLALCTDCQEEYAALLQAIGQIRPVITN
jgi:hypothetical protein